jgi:hypothetical protein
MSKQSVFPLVALVLAEAPSSQLLAQEQGAVLDALLREGGLKKFQADINVKF